jgi:hypothetical protein
MLGGVGLGRLPSAECEPWAKTGGLADVVDALARALAVSRPDRRAGGRLLPDTGTCRTRGPRAWSKVVADPVTRRLEVTIVDVAADGYRLRLVDARRAEGRVLLRRRRGGTRSWRRPRGPLGRADADGRAASTTETGPAAVHAASP